MTRDPRNIVRLRVAGRDFVAKKGVTITRSLEHVCSSFSLETSVRGPGGRRVRVVIGDPCEVFIGDDRVLKGFVNSVDIESGPRVHAVEVTGRSKTQDPVDCSAVADPAVWRNVNIEVIAQVLASYYGVDVFVDPTLEAGTGGPWPKHVLQPDGETVVESIERMINARGLILTDTTSGDLMITGLGQASTTDVLRRPGNILWGRSHRDDSQRFSDYLARGQRAGDDAVFGEDAALLAGDAQDQVMRRRRTLILPADKAMSIADCKKRAEWEAATRAGKSMGYECRVAGWRQSDGSLWEPGLLAPVDDPDCDVKGKFLIVSTTFGLTRSEGTVCGMKLTPPEAYIPKAPKPKKAGGGTSWDELSGVTLDEYGDEVED